MSADGRYVIFDSSANNFVPSDNAYVYDVFVKDMVTGEVKLLSTNGTDTSYWPSISADGRYATFTSYASNLVPGHTNDSSDVFRVAFQPEVAPSAPSMPDFAAASDTGASATDNPTNAASLVFTGTAAAGLTVILSNTSGEIGRGTATEAGTYSIAVAGHAEGAHGITARAESPTGVSVT